MKKIPPLFTLLYNNNKHIGISSAVTPGFEWVFNGEGTATVQYDGSCCAIINGQLYRRYDAKKGKKPPEDAIPCCDPDPITGRWPHWVKCKRDNPSDKWFWTAYDNTPLAVEDGTYEAVGVHFQGNPYNFPNDMLYPHGLDKIKVLRTFNGIRSYLEEHAIEGIVFWKDGEPQCKIKRSDFGFPWPVKKGREKQMTKPEDLIDRQAVIKELDLIYDCADMVFEPDDHCCHQKDCKGCKWWQTRNYIRDHIVAKIPAADLTNILRRNTTMLNIGETVFVICKLFTEGDKFRIYVATKEINRIERNDDGDIIYTAGKHRELRFHKTDDGIYQTLGERPKIVYLDKAIADAARSERYANEMASLTATKNVAN